jgi:hypothetical protein
MATQGATLERRGLHLPIWPIAVLVAIAIVTAITLITVRALEDARPAQPVTSVGETELESGVGHPSPRGATMETVRQARAMNAWAARVHDLPAGPFHESGRAHEVVVYTRGLPR